MKDSDLKSYLNILEIRLQAARRNMRLIGLIFILSLLAFFAFGILGRLEGLELYVISPILVAFALGYIHSLIKYETTKVLHELVDKLAQEGGAS